MAVGLGSLAFAACGTPGVKRDLSRVPVGQVGFDDLCGLQNYFDDIAVKNATAPAVIDAADIERVSDGSTTRGGRARFAFETDLQLKTVKRVLDENWKALPPGLSAAKRIELDVTWSERSGLRRVANNSSPELVVDGTPSALPYHVCLSELLFGERLYGQRRDMLGLAPLQTKHSLALGTDAAADAGVPEVAVPVPAPAPAPAPTAGVSLPVSGK